MTQAVSQGSKPCALLLRGDAGVGVLSTALVVHWVCVRRGGYLQMFSVLPGFHFSLTLPPGFRGISAPSPWASGREGFGPVRTTPEETTKLITGLEYLCYKTG